MTPTAPGQIGLPEEDISCCCSKLAVLVPRSIHRITIIRFLCDGLMFLTV